MPNTNYRTVKSTTDATPYPNGATVYTASANILLSADAWKSEYGITLNSLQLRQNRIEFQTSDPLPADELSSMPYFQVV